MTSRYAGLSREQLAILVPELLLIGQMIDRSGMAWCISNFGREEMLQIAIEEWTGASPIYTKRMQRALKLRGRRHHRRSSRACNSTSARRRSSWTSATPCTTAGTASSTSTTAARCSTSSRWARTTSAACATTSRTRPSTRPPSPPTPRRRSGPIHRPPRVPADRHPHCAWTVDHRRVIIPTSRACRRWS